MKKLIAALLFALASASSAVAAPCGPIPALPDTTRRTEYTGIVAQTGPFNVNFQLYGDQADYGAWLSVWVNGVIKTPVTDFVVTSPSGALGSLCLPITDAQVTFVAPQTGTIEIEGGQRPRRLSEFSENAGVTAHALNQVFNTMTAQLRERWDRETRLVRSPPGEVLSVLPPAATRANGLLGFDSTGQTALYTNSLGGIIAATCGAHQWFSALSAGGAFTCTQPAFPDISGQIAISQIPNTAVTPLTYGDGNHVGQFTVDQQGRLTAASSVTIAALPPPAGRLTLTSGLPVMAQTSGGGGSVTGATTVFYTPYQGNNVPIAGVSAICPEISNIITNSSVGNAGPFAVAANSVYDLYVWNNGGICTLTRSDYWQQIATVTNTNASPAVFTHTAHGLVNGSTVRLICIGGGSLSPGFTANTSYYVVSVAANTYQLAATVGGAPINAGGASTCVTSQQATEGVGNPTSINANVTRATVGTVNAQSRVNGFLVNTNAIINGPGAGLGTYVGTIATNSTGTLDYKFGFSGSGGVAASFQVYNYYNKVTQGTSVEDSQAFYPYTSNTIRLAGNSAGNTISFIIGQQEESSCATYTQKIVTVAAASAFGTFAIGLDNSAGFDTPGFTVFAPTANQMVGQGTVSICLNQWRIGEHQFQAIEQGDGVNANLFGAASGIGGTLSATVRN